MSSETFTQTAGQLITNALRDARIIAAEQPIEAIDLANGLIAINLILKHWQAQGHHLWSVTEAILPLITGKRKYLLGPSGDDIGTADTFLTTTLTAPLVATNTVITLAATSGTNEDGQTVTMAGAPGILLSNPATSTQDWTTGNSGTIAIVSGILQLANGGAASGSTDYIIDTTIGTTFQIEVGIVIGTAGSANIFIFDAGNATLASTSVSIDTTVVLAFTATTLTTRFRMSNGSTIINQNNSISSLQFRDKSAGDRIGIELDDATRFWDNIVTVDSATQVTINNGVPSAAASGKSVYTYGTAIARPLRVLQTRFGETFTSSEIPVNQWSRSEYFDQPDKDSSGTVVNWYYSPALSRGQLYLWQVANSINQVLRITYVDPINVPTDTTDSLEFPSEWYLPLKWAIADELGPAYGVSVERQIILKQNAATTLQEALDFDVDRDSMSLQPDFN